MDETGQKSIHLSFEIKYKPEEYREICFEVDYVLPKIVLIQIKYIRLLEISTSFQK